MQRLQQDFVWQTEGGSGDIAVLGAANRLELISYAQLSSRVGGGIVLIIASFFFSFFL